MMRALKVVGSVLWWLVKDVIKVVGIVAFGAVVFLLAATWRDARKANDSPPSKPAIIKPASYVPPLGDLSDHTDLRLRI